MMAKISRQVNLRLITHSQLYFRPCTQEVDPKQEVLWLSYRDQTLLIVIKLHASLVVSRFKASGFLMRSLHARRLP